MGHQQGELLHLRHGEGRGRGQEAGQQQQQDRYHLVIVDAVTTDHQPSLCDDDTADAGNAEERRERERTLPCVLSDRWRDI